MDDLMARTMVENLSVGIHPLTGEALPPRDACSNEVIQEALETVLKHCTLESYATVRTRQKKEKEERLAQRKEQRKLRYPNQGTSWTVEDEWKLRALYNNGYSISHIANILKRSPQAIHSHITKMGY